jgi:hypothetical protein
MFFDSCPKWPPSSLAKRPQSLRRQTKEVLFPLLAATFQFCWVLISFGTLTEMNYIRTPPSRRKAHETRQQTWEIRLMYTRASGKAYDSTLPSAYHTEPFPAANTAVTVACYVLCIIHKFRNLGNRLLTPHSNLL